MDDCRFFAGLGRIVLYNIAEPEQRPNYRPAVITKVLGDPAFEGVSVNLRVFLDCPEDAHVFAAKHGDVGEHAAWIWPREHSYS